jgi:hypothetical protein
MSEYSFSLILLVESMTQDEILATADALAESGCGDASIRGHRDGVEVIFHRSAQSLQAAISSAVSDVESAGYQVGKIELEREAITGKAS